MTWEKEPVTGDYKKWLQGIIQANDPSRTPDGIVNTIWYDYQILYDSKKYPDPSKITLDWLFGCPTDPFGQIAYHPFFSEESYYSGKVHELYNPKGFIGGKLWYDNDGVPIYQLSQSQVNNNWESGGTYQFLISISNKAQVLNPEGEAYDCNYLNMLWLEEIEDIPEEFD